MSLKARIQSLIVALVATVVLTLSVLHIHGVIATRFHDVLELANISAAQIESAILQIVNEQSPTRSPSTNSVKDITEIWADTVKKNTGLLALLQSLVGSSPVIVEVVVSKNNNQVLVCSLPSKTDQMVRPLPRFQDFEQKSLWRKIKEVLAQNQDYAVTRDLGIVDHQAPIFTVHVILSSVLLRSQVVPQIRDLTIVSAGFLLLSIMLAFLASRVATRPLTRISEIIDRIRRGEFLTQPESTISSTNEIAVVESKLNLLGEKFRDVQADRTQLLANVDRLLERMEDAVLLFGHDNRLVMAGRAASRILGGRWEIMGSRIEDIFPDSTDLGALVQSSVQLRQPITDTPVIFYRDTEAPLQLLVSVEVLEQFPNHERLSTLVTLRDASPRRELESQLDISNRLASISRLTGGAAHEIKNPLNSIALHLEVLRSQLEDSSTTVKNEIKVISREITRLDGVVKSFLDFTRPLDLNFQPIDLVALIEELQTLIDIDAKRQNVQVAVKNKVHQAPIKGDHNLLKQGVLNVVMNSMEAMPEGGKLEISVLRCESDWLVTIQDEGDGIPDELSEKIYDLYFTTKGQGSGIGLAMTFRVISLHGGTIDFTSNLGKGTQFRIYFPVSKEIQHQSTTQYIGESSKEKM